MMWSGAFVLLLLSLATPFSMFTLSFLIIPILFLYVTLERRSFIIHAAVILAIILLLTGGSGRIFIALFFMVPAIVMGYMYKKQLPAHVVIFGTMMAIIAEILLSLTIASIAGMNLLAEAELIMRESLGMMTEVMGPQFDQAYIDGLIFTMTQMIPTYMIMFAVYYTIVTHWLGRIVLKRAGYELPGLPPVRTWRLPRSIVWLYVGLMVFNLLFNTTESSLLTMILFNLTPILTFAFCVQGVSFLFYVVHVKGWNKALPVIGIIGSLFYPTLVSLLGVFDIILDLRNRIQGNNENGQER